MYFSIAVNTDGTAANWTREKAAHLARSVLFSADKNTIDVLYNAGTVNAAINILFPDAIGPDRSGYDTFITNYTSSGFNWWDGNHATRLYQLQYALDPYEAKRKLFSLFEDIFSVNNDSGRSIGYRDIYDQHSLIYNNLLGNYQILLKKIVFNNGQPGDFAEWAFLDLFNQDTPNNPNENYARELVQLFMMGEYEPFKWKEANDPRNYEESDVKALAKLLTGLKSDAMTHAITFDINKHYTGSTLAFLSGSLSTPAPIYYTSSGTIDPTLITQSVNGNNWLTDNVVEYIFAKRKQQIALFLADRLYRFYIDDTPTRGELDTISTIILSNNFEMLSSVKQILALDIMYSDAAMNTVHYKNPLELAIGTIKLLRNNTLSGIILDANIYDTNLLRRLGWTPYYPGSVFWRDGFDDSLKWASTSSQNAWMTATNYFTYRTSGTWVLDFRIPLGNYRKELTNETISVMTSLKNAFTGSLIIASGILDSTPISGAQITAFSLTGTDSNTGITTDTGSSNTGELVDTGAIIWGSWDTNTGSFVDTGILLWSGSTSDTWASITPPTDSGSTVDSWSIIMPPVDSGSLMNTGAFEIPPPTNTGWSDTSSGSTDSSLVAFWPSLEEASMTFSTAPDLASSGSTFMISSGSVVMSDFSLVTDQWILTIYSGSYDAMQNRLTLSSGSLSNSWTNTPIYSWSIQFQNGGKVTTDILTADDLIRIFEDSLLIDKRLLPDTHDMVKKFLETDQSGTLLPIAPSRIDYYDRNIRGLVSILLSQPEYVLLRGYDAPVFLDSNEQHFLDNITGKLFFVELYGWDDYLSSIVPKDEYATYQSYRTNSSGSIALPLANLVDIGNFYMNSALAYGSGWSPGFKSLFDGWYLKIFNRVGSYRHSQDHDAAARQITSYENSTELSAQWAFWHLVEKEFESSHTISLWAKRPNIYRWGHYINMGGNVILSNPLSGSQTYHMDTLSQISQSRQYPGNTRDLFKDAGRISDIAKISVSQWGPSGANGDMNNIFRFSKVLMNNNIGRSYYMGWYGWYDTHGDQYDYLNNNLNFVASSVTQFFNEVKDTQDVTIVIFSEFWRTNKVNGSLGTDHGDGGGMLVLTSNQNLRNTLSAGTYGNMSIKNAKANSLWTWVDYRSVYGSIFKWLYGLDGATYFGDPTISLDNDVSLDPNDISLLSYDYRASGNNVIMNGEFNVSWTNYNPWKAGYTRLLSGTWVNSLRNTTLRESSLLSWYRYTFQLNSQNQQYYSIDSFSNQYVLTNISGSSIGSSTTPMILWGSVRTISSTGSSILPIFQSTIAPVILAGSGLILHNSFSGASISIPSSSMRILFSSGLTNVTELTSSSGNLTWNGGFILGELIDRDLFLPRNAVLLPNSELLDHTRVARLIKLGADKLWIGMKLSQSLRLEFTNVPSPEKYRVITSEDGVNWTDLEWSGSEYQRNAGGSIIVSTNHLSYFALLSQSVVIPAPTCTLTANPTSVYNNTPTTLSWSIQNTQTGLLQPLGTVLVSSGSQSIIPPNNATTQYILSVQNSSGNNTCTVLVTSSQNPWNPPIIVVTWPGGPSSPIIPKIDPVAIPVVMPHREKSSIEILFENIGTGMISIDSMTDRKIYKFSFDLWKDILTHREDRDQYMKQVIRSFTDMRNVTEDALQKKVFSRIITLLNSFAKNSSRGKVRTIEQKVQDAEVAVASTVYKYVEVEHSLNFRKSMYIGISNILWYLTRNTRVQVQDEKNGWTKILYDGIEGFVKSRFLRSETVEDNLKNSEKVENIKKWTIQVYSAYIRARPDLDSAIVANLHESESVSILSESDGWCEIAYGNNDRGYVMSELVVLKE